MSPQRKPSRVSGRRKSQSARRPEPDFEAIMATMKPYRDAAAAATSWSIHETPAGRLRWLMDFLRRDPAQLDSAEKLEAGSRLRAFLPSEPGTGWSTTGSPMAISDAEISRIHARLADGMRRLLAGEQWSLPVPREAALYRMNKNPKRLQVAQTVIADGDDATVLGVASLIRSHGERLRACKRCQAPFYGIKRQEFCSPSCGQKTRDEKKAQGIITKPATGGSR